MNSMQNLEENKEDFIPPNPGSEAATALGCVCPVLDNAKGKGINFGGEVVFWINGNCKLHGGR